MGNSHAQQPVCSILPPYLVERLTRHDDPAVAEAAQRTLRLDREVRGRRETRAARVGSGRRAPSQPPTGAEQGIIPPYLRHAPAPTAPPEGVAPATGHEPQRQVDDAKHGTTLPGTPLRHEGEPPVADTSANEAYDSLGATWQLYWTAYQRDSLDGAGLPLVASVHYDTGFDNAFWDGEQMVFGDGDGTWFRSFTDCIDVIGHELTHGVTQFTAGLTYVGQSGALNESVSDVFGSLVKQMSLGQTAEQADWLIGQGLFTPRVHGVALRSMKAPGTAYDDPHLGKDPQPSTMDGYVDLPHDDQHDNGAVHTNSGIPNHAFYLAATAVGGHAWEGAGQVWYDVLTGSGLPKDVDFHGFATATVEAAGKRFGVDSRGATAVQDAWTRVKVL